LILPLTFTATGENFMHSTKLATTLSQTAVLIKLV
jgi:hypothetical protein